MFEFVAASYPEEPGCYLMKDRIGTVIYVGKAVNLRKRLASYFHPKPDRAKIARLVRDIADIDIMIMSNEHESLVLEHNLIKRYRPKYNRALKRGQAVYAYVQSTDERYPRLVPRDLDRFDPAGPEEAEANKFIGPFLHDKLRDMALEFVWERFGLRTCEPLGERVCMSFYLGKCGGPCERKVSEAEYAEGMRQAARLLADPDALVAEMERTVEELADKLRFEKAKTVHKRLKAIRNMLEDQAVNRRCDRHQWVVYFGERYALAARLDFGVLRSEFVWFEHAGEHDGGAQPLMVWKDNLSAAGRIELIANDEAKARQLERMLNANGRYDVEVTIPENGAEHRLLRLCERNYAHRLQKIAIRGYLGTCSRAVPK